MIKNLIALILLFWINSTESLAQLIAVGKTNFDLSTASIIVDKNDFILVRRSAELLQQDIQAVTGKKLPVLYSLPSTSKNNIIIGTISHSGILQEFESKNNSARAALKNQWEGYEIKTVKNNLVIAGSDRRGTSYGIFELSRQIGVSPWYWWADVPIKKQSSIYINTKAIISDAPKVKYRGIFINDEAPAFSGWTKEKFGGVNHQVYEKVFELILRLKGNYLWPAMWGNAFNDDDSLNPVKADEWGIVMGTSHHEPMLRSQQEWKRYGTGKWNYDSNEVALKAFWKKGIENMGRHESILTMGMRGDGDEPMTQGTATALLERIVRDQRSIIEEVTKKPAAEAPQLWALYKEVQDYYDKGMRVPDDVTLLLCDDNWGNIRKLPQPGEKARKGGYGIYYHFDYVGGPRNYKWLNTNPIPRIWEQMHLAYEHHVKNIWIVNVGDIKPMEFPISFFLDYAWNPDKISAADITKYTEEWAAGQFGNTHAKDIAYILSAYSKINGRRKPELLDANTYSLENYNEAGTVIKDFNELLLKAEKINSLLPAACRDAFFQLVLHPVKACANLNELYYYVALNKKAYKQHYAIANNYADKVKQLYANDSHISQQYNQLNNGKWNHMMDQTHIGYTYWQQPNIQKMPEIKYVPRDSIVSELPNGVPPAEKMAVVPAGEKGNIFYERENYGVSMEAAHFSKAHNSNGITWTVLPDHGRTGSAITSFPVTATGQHPGGISPMLEYTFYSYSKDSLKLMAYFSPTLNFHNSDTGLRYAVSIDDERPQIVSINKEGKNPGAGIWNKWVAENIIIKNTTHRIGQPGRHVLKYWMVDSGVVLQKLVIDFGGVKQSYLGPPETKVK
ncbi:MAG: glycosyhydrolase [Chitinophagaceae bacterium]|nr:MAG: glycosyhydrolase [Chitinophagaceae bacterium]